MALHEDLLRIIEEEEAPLEFAEELKARGVLKVNVLGAVSTEEKFEELILKHVRWQGEEVTHVGKKLCSINVWAACRKIRDRRHGPEVKVNGDSPVTFGKKNGTADTELDEMQVQEAVSIDVLFSSIGEFGFYQQRHYTLVASAWISCSWCTMSMVFVNAKPSWKYPGGEVQNSDMPCNGTVIELVDTWHSVQGEWNLVCEAGWKAGAIDSFFFVGFGIGAFLMGSLAGTLGRRKVFFGDCLLSSVAVLLSAAAPSFEAYMLLRCLVGVGIGGLGIVTFVLASEFIGASRQGITGVFQGALFSIGNVLLTPLAYSFPGWRSLTVATGLSPLIFILLIRLVPESPRWLLAKGHVSAASSVMSEIARGNGRELPKGQVLADTPSKTEVGVLTLFKGVLLKRTLVMFYVWFAYSFVFYGLALSSGNLGGSLYVNFALGSLSEIPSILLACCLVDSLGRRVMLFGASLLSGVACSLCMLLSHGPATTAAATVGRFGVYAAFSIIFVYAAELFPTVVRSVGMGLSSTWARVGGVVAPGVVLMSSVFEALPLMIFGAVAIFAGLLILILPETSGKPLPESVEDCELQVIRKGHVKFQDATH